MTRPPFSIPQSKLTNYLLDVNHHSGGPKAKFFLAHSFRLDDLDALVVALITHAAQHWPGSLVPSSWGEHHELIGPMDFPDGSRRAVLAVWEVRSGEAPASFVTAYPR